MVVALEPVRPEAEGLEPARPEVVDRDPVEMRGSEVPVVLIESAVVVPVVEPFLWLMNSEAFSLYTWA